MNEENNQGAGDDAQGISRPARASGNEASRAVIYMRVASAHTRDRELSTVAQQHQCEQRATELGAMVAQVYADYGSGASENRPMLCQMLDYIDAVRDDPGLCISNVIAASSTMIALTTQVYAWVVWRIEKAGASLSIASIPLEAYAAMSDGLLGRASRPSVEVVELLEGIARIARELASEEHSRRTVEGEQAGRGSDEQTDA